MKNWKSAVLAPDAPIKEAMKIIDLKDTSNPALFLPKRMALVADLKGKLIGVVTDGDIRRGVLNGYSVSQPVSLIMNAAFSSILPGTPKTKILIKMKEMGLWQLPVVDDKGSIRGLKLFEELVELKQRDNWVILMAGGLGKRLAPLTNDCPKPLLKVGEKPILQIILENFVKFGFRNFFISVNYKAEMIRAKFGDGAKWGVSINYIYERKHKGTAGALSLLPSRPNKSIIVMNGDVLTQVNIQHVLEFHEKNDSFATMCVREYHIQVPYGVLRTEQHRIIGISEKPKFRHLVNAGMYILEPAALNFVAPNSAIDMPSLFEKLLELGYQTMAFPILEYWLDIGRLADLEKANEDFVNGSLREDKFQP